ncbi:MAG TPA: ATPase P, partial [Deltaproteobacteria bacterium]|nr:ATPase P [Deltaproteobacteria bacterium]
MEIPGRGTWEIENLVLDFNGTIAKDGRINPKVKDKINLLGKKLKVYVLTADTRGDVAQRMVKMRAELVRLK